MRYMAGVCGVMVFREAFTVQLVQAAIFTVDQTSFSNAKAVAIILQKYGERFAGEMQALKLPPELPAEVPHVILKSPDEAWRMQLSPARVDAVWTNRDLTPAIKLDEVTQDCAGMLEHYMREARCKVGRAAFIVHRICFDDNPAKALTERFCSPETLKEPFNRSSNFEIHNHKVYTPIANGIDYKINSWVRCKTAELEGDGKSIIQVIQDLNTLAADAKTRQFSTQQISTFFTMARTEAEAIFVKYFPGKE